MIGCHCHLREQLNCSDWSDFRRDLPADQWYLVFLLGDPSVRAGLLILNSMILYSTVVVKALFYNNLNHQVVESDKLTVS
jgi:hypothetical protein